MWEHGFPSPHCPSTDLSPGATSTTRVAGNWSLALGHTEKKVVFSEQPNSGGDINVIKSVELCCCCLSPWAFYGAVHTGSAGRASPGRLYIAKFLSDFTSWITAFGAHRPHVSERHQVIVPEGKLQSQRGSTVSSRISGTFRAGTPYFGPDSSIQKLP